MFKVRNHDFRKRFFMFKVLLEHIFVLAVFLVGAVEDLLSYYPVIFFLPSTFFCYACLAYV